MAGDDLAHLLAAGDMGVHHFADVAVQFRGGALGFGLDLRAEISAFLPVHLDQGSAERQLQALVVLQAGGEVFSGIADRVGKARGIDRGLGGAGGGIDALRDAR
jgi:hypothetical protein